MPKFENLTVEALQAKITERRSARLAGHVVAALTKRKTFGEGRPVQSSEGSPFTVGSHEGKDLHWIEFSDDDVRILQEGEQSGEHPEQLPA